MRRSSSSSCRRVRADRLAMPMTYTSLVAPKGTAGAIANWVGYGKLDIVTILEEAQSIIFQSLRTREMRTEYVFGVSIGQSSVALPPRFLDPISRIQDNNACRYVHKDESTVKSRRMYQPVSGGVLGNNPFTSGLVNSSTVAVNIPSHGLSQGSDVTFPTSTPAVDGINLSGTFPVTSIIDANNVVVTSPAGDQAQAGGVNGGGASVTWTGNLLIQTSPSCWAIYDEAIQFDGAFDTAVQCRLLYFRSPPLLSATNPTNFLTNRYPRLIREATNAAAASFMKDDNEEQKAMTKLGALIDSTNAESDLMYRGADLTTDTPGSNGYYGGQ